MNRERRTPERVRFHVVGTYASKGKKLTNYDITQPANGEYRYWFAVLDVQCDSMFLFDGDSIRKVRWWKKGCGNLETDHGLWRRYKDLKLKIQNDISLWLRGEVAACVSSFDALRGR